MDTESELYKLFNIHLYKKNSESSAFGVLSPYLDSGEVLPEDLQSGSIAGNLEYTGGYIQSANFVAGTSGWRLDSDGTLTAVNATLSGTITATSGTIGGTTISATALTGGTIQTASGTGQRIVMSGSDNTLTFYNASNAVVAQIGAGASIANALRITLDASTSTGVRVVSSTANDIGFAFTNSGNYDSTGITIDLSGATNTGTAVNVNHDGSSGEGVYIDTSAGARALQIANTGGGVPIYITNSGAGSMYLSHSHDGSIGIEIDYSGRNEALSITGTDADSNEALIYATSNHTSASTPTVLFNRSTIGPVLSITASMNSSSNYPVGIKINIANAGSSEEAAFEFAGSEYIAGATSVSTVTGVIKIITSDGLCYLPVYSSYA